MKLVMSNGHFRLYDAPPASDAEFARKMMRRVSTSARYHKRHKRWNIPVSHDAIRGLEELNVPLPADVARWKAEQEQLARARDAANKLKRADPEAVRRKLEAGGVRFKKTLFPHQVITMAYALKLRACGLFLDTGTGKTATMATIMQALADHRGLKRFLIIAPKSILDTSWGTDIDDFSWLKWVNISDPPRRDPVLTCPRCRREFKKHVTWRHMRTHMRKTVERLGDDTARAALYTRHPELRPLGEDDRRERLLRALESDAQVFLINPEAFKIVVDDLLDQDWDMFVVDESSCLKTNTSQITQAVIAFGHNVGRRVAMTATPRPNSSLDFWGQMAFLDQCLGGNFYRFRANYYYSDREGFNWMPKHADVDGEIRDIVFERCIRYRLDDCVDLPGESYETVEVELSSELRKHYQDMEKKMLVELDSGETVSTSWLIVQMNKLAQINSGYIFDDAGEPRWLGESPKIAETVRMAKQLIESEDRSVVIWVRFPRTEGKLIHEALDKFGVSTMHGGTKNHAASSEAFKKGRNRVMIAHPSSAKFGHTWVGHCNVDIFHSFGYSFEDFYQSKRRIYRIGQTRPVTHVTVVAKRTVDEIILDAVMYKQESHEEVVDNNVIARLARMARGGASHARRRGR